MEKLLMKKMLFQYKLTRKKHYLSLLKSQLKTIFLFLLFFTFCYYAINLEAFLYNFPYNTPLVIKTYLIFIIVIFLLMFIISSLYSFIITCLFKKNKAYKLYEYEINDKGIMEKNSNFILNLNDIKTVKFKKNYIKIISFKLKMVIIFEKNNFLNTKDFDILKQKLIKK